MNTQLKLLLEEMIKNKVPEQTSHCQTHRDAIRRKEVEE